ncbi:glycosyltransferase [Mycetocola tolaasinivorans]|uniref:Glycosyltransferase n=1 Tax=Mycetocola tolaasinivorans TaxID=76635 RepID=A0A3L6ZXM6_9MICO|nr:glycosyltransferase family 4 protein [Mycetocola tolaasinivorans]RLP71892.1 glycosyltransferase [Mycetocola tolaasinivorans]
MRIALVIDYSLDYLGGAQTAVIAQADALTAAGHSVLVVAPAGRTEERARICYEWVRAPFTLPGLGLPVIPHREPLRDHLTALFVRERIARVHVHSEFGLAAAALAAARTLDIPTAHTVHTFFWQTGLPTMMQRLIAPAIGAFHRWMTGLPRTGVTLPAPPADAALRSMTLATAQHADVVISPSQHQAARLREAGLPAVIAIPNTAARTREPTALPPLSAERTGAPTPLRVLWIGRCVPEKRLLPFVRAALRALSRVRPGTLEIDIVGAGPQLTAAQQLVGETPGIVFHGRLTEAEVSRSIARSHLVALTFYGFDNQPMTIVEALAGGRGVFYVDPALTEGLVTVGESGAGIRCVDPSITCMADTLVRLVSQPDTVRAAAAHALAACADFSPARVVALLEDAYHAAETPRLRSDAALDLDRRPIHHALTHDR